MTDETRCPKCGTPMAPAAGGPACPRCLLAAGLESGGPEGAASAAPSPEEMGKHFPQFEILELLGQGGMGVVYKAKQRSLDRLVALKVMPPEAAREAGFSDRFTREARTLARLQHPNIVGVHDFGVADGLYYLVMEFIDGANLREAMRAGRLSAREALAVVPQVCDALQYAHDQGVVHRDIKPENILLDRAGRVRIADFGLAKIVQRSPVDMTITRAGQVMGTLHYMAPEQYRTPDSVDHRADIYSLGVVFYEMLTGELPLGSFPPPSAKAGVDARLDGVVLRALERDRERRWQHASDVKTGVSAISSDPGAAGAAGAAAAAAEAAGPARTVEGHGSVGSGPGGKEVYVRKATFRLGDDPAAVGPDGKPPRLSRLAVAGGLGIPAAMLAGLLVAGFCRLVSLPWSAAAFYAFLLVGLAGWIASIAAWARIRHSGGALSGTGWAAAGTFVAPGFLCCGAPGILLFGAGPSLGGIGVHQGPDGTRVSVPGISVEEGPDGTRVRLPGMTIEDTPEGSRVKMPGITIEDTPAVPGDASVAADACLVHGGPQGRAAPDLAAVARAIRALWASRGPEFVRRPVQVKVGEATIPWTPGGPASDYRLFAVALEETGKAGRAVLTDSRSTIAIRVERDGDSWVLVETDWEQRVGDAVKEYEDGWLYR